jgi:hypothetical protein
MTIKLYHRSELTEIWDINKFLNTNYKTVNSGIKKQGLIYGIP